MDYLEKARRVLDIEIFELQRLRDRLGENFSRAVELIKEAVDARGKVVVLGVGKSGHVGRQNRIHAHQHRLARGRARFLKRAARRSRNGGGRRRRPGFEFQRRDGGVGPRFAGHRAVSGEDHRGLRRRRIRPWPKMRTFFWM